MNKFTEYGILAEKYYVEEQQSLLEISKKLNITTKTLTEWKNKERWEEKRKNFLSSQ